MTLVRNDPSVGVLVPGMMLAGLGWGTINVTATELALAAVEPERAGMATGTLNVLRQIGLAAGIAALGAIFEGAADKGLADALATAFLVGAGVTALGALAVVALLGASPTTSLAPAAAHPAEQRELA